MVETKNFDWLPRLQTLSLQTEVDDSEHQQLRDLRRQLESTTSMVHELSRQLVCTCVCVCGHSLL